MGGSRPRAVKWDRVLIDVCTQRDFLEPGAILQVANRDPLIESLRKLFEFVRTAGRTVVSTIESHRPAEPIADFPLHCVDGAPGQRKLGFTLVEPRLLIETDNCLSLPPDLLENYRQLIFRKRSREVLSNPKADRFLTGLRAEEFIIIGVGLERTIRGLALGLLARHKKVTVIPDCCGYWSGADADLSLRQLNAKGIQLISLTDFLAREAEAMLAPRKGRGTRRKAGSSSARAEQGRADHAEAGGRSHRQTANS